MKSRMAKRRISQKTAQKIVLGMAIASVCLAIGRIFIHPDLVGALIGVSSAPIFYWVYKNPEILMSKDSEEFGAVFDNSTDRKYLLGFPLLHALVVSVILYFWLQ